MKKVTNLKIQYSLKKTYTYNFFRLLNKSNLVFLQNNFNFMNYFKLLNFFFFQQSFFFNKLKFDNISTLFYKNNVKEFLFINKFQKKKYTNLIGKNYAVDLSMFDEKKDNHLLMFFKNYFNQFDFFKNNYINYTYWCDNNFSNYYSYNYLFYIHSSILTSKNINSRS